MGETPIYDDNRVVVRSEIAVCAPQCFWNMLFTMISLLAVFIASIQLCSFIWYSSQVIPSGLAK